MAGPQQPKLPGSQTWTGGTLRPPSVSVPVLATTHSTASRAEHHEDGADHQQDDPDRPQD